MNPGLGLLDHGLALVLDYIKFLAQGNLVAWTTTMGILTLVVKKVPKQLKEYCRRHGVIIVKESWLKK